MSTPPADHPVKQALLDKLRSEVLPALEALVAGLPPNLADAAEAAGAEVLRGEDEQRHRVAGRREPLPDSPLVPDRACLFADGTTVHTAGDWHEVRVATATAADAAGRPLARQSRARFLPVA